jgi:hypothetical protein
MGLVVVGKKPSKVPLIYDARPAPNFVFQPIGNSQAEEDAQILIKAEEIKRDPFRLRKAKALIKGALG